MKPKRERCATVIQWKKGINAAAYPGPKETSSHRNKQSQIACLVDSRIS